MSEIEYYKRCVIEIDMYKNKELELGLTKKCKEEIDKCYEKIAGKEKSLEIELYGRKEVLINDISKNSSVEHNVNMSFWGAFCGVGVGSTVDYLISTIQSVYDIIKKGNYVQIEPMDIIREGTPEKPIVTLIVIYGIFLLYLFYSNKRARQSHSTNGFCVSLCEYELDKIKEVLKKM